MQWTLKRAARKPGLVVITTISFSFAISDDVPHLMHMVGLVNRNFSPVSVHVIARYSIKQLEPITYRALKTAWLFNV